MRRQDRNEREEVDGKESYVLLSMMWRYKMNVVQSLLISNKLQIKCKGPILKAMGNIKVVWINDEKDCIIVEGGSRIIEKDLEVVF